MSAREKGRLIITQKQLTIAIRALKAVRDDGEGYTFAAQALEDIERIQVTQETSK